MAFSSEFERQRYSQELHAYTLVQFSAARTLLDQHKAAADKLPAVNAYDYRLEKQPTSQTQTLTSQRGRSPASNSESDNIYDSQ